MLRGQIDLDRHHLAFRALQRTVEIPLPRVTLDLEKKGSRVYFYDDERPELMIYTADDAILQHPAFTGVASLRDQASAILSRRELSRRLRLVAYALVGCVVIACSLSWGSGMLVNYLARRVPPEVERKFGDDAVHSLQEKGRLVDDTNKIAMLAALAGPLARVLPPGENQLQFHICRDEEPNAFALPGGHIVVNAGMLSMADRPEELLGVLAHEMAHVTQRHHFRHIISAAGPLLVFGVFLHSRDGMLNTIAAGSGIMVYQGFSQEYEKQADDVGWQYLVAAGINPDGMISVFRKLQAYEEKEKLGHVLPQAFQSHPAINKRIARLESRLSRTLRHHTFQPLTNAVPKLDAAELERSRP